MKKLFTLYFILSVAIGLSQDTEYKISKFWETPDILTTSESVCYYSDEKVLFVSCINGNPTDKDGNGFIAQVSLAGEIMMHKWATGLNAPKGMGISGGSLFVSDIDRVVRINVKNGEIIKVYKLENAKFLNDIIVDSRNNIYISDMFSNNIYSIQSGTIELWVSSDMFENPNGVNILNGELLIGTKKGIFGVGLENKNIRHLIKGTGGIDGLELFENNYFIISDWMGKVQLVHAERESILLLNTTDQSINAADIEYIAEQNLLLIPTFGDNRVTAYKVIRK